MENSIWSTLAEHGGDYLLGTAAIIAASKTGNSGSSSYPPVNVLGQGGDPQPTGNNTLMWAGIGGGVLLLIIILYFALKSK